MASSAEMPGESMVGLSRRGVNGQSSVHQGMTGVLAVLGSGTGGAAMADGVTACLRAGGTTSSEGSSSETRSVLGLDDADCCICVPEEGIVNRSERLMP